MAGRIKGATPPNPIPNGADHEAEIETAEVIVEGEAGVETAAAAAPQVDEGVQSLQQQLDEEKRRREAAEREAETLRTERGKDQKVLTDSRLLVIDSTIQSHEQKKIDIKRRIAEAKEAGDYAAETEAMDELSVVNIDLKQAKLGKDRLEQQIEEGKNAPQTDDEKFEAWTAANNIHPKSKAWLREHMEYLQDDVKNAELTLADRKARKAGHAPNTPGYFEAIETELGLRGGQEQVEEQVEETTERTTAAPAAPVSRSPSLRNGGAESPIPGIIVRGPGKYTVTNDANGRAVREAAEMSGMTVGAYVEEAMKLKRGPDGQLH
jgi:hypothetical protein